MSQKKVSKALGTGVVIEAVESMTGAASIAPDDMGRGRRPAVGYVPKATTVDRALQQEIEALLYRQAAFDYVIQAWV